MESCFLMIEIGVAAYSDWQKKIFDISAEDFSLLTNSNLMKKTVYLLSL